MKKNLIQRNKGNIIHQMEQYLSGKVIPVNRLSLELKPLLQEVGETIQSVKHDASNVTVCCGTVTFRFQGMYLPVKKAFQFKKVK